MAEGTKENIRGTRSTGMESSTRKMGISMMDRGSMVNNMGSVKKRLMEKINMENGKMEESNTCI